MTTAMYQFDADTILNHTHPMILENMGGKPEAVIIMTETFDGMRQAELELESLSFPTAPSFLESTKHFFVIVPTETLLKTKSQRVTSTAYQFGVQTKGSASWKYIDGTTVSRLSASALFDDFPKDFQLPDTNTTYHKLNKADNNAMNAKPHQH